MNFIIHFVKKNGEESSVGIEQPNLDNAILRAMESVGINKSELERITYEENSTWNERSYLDEENELGEKVLNIKEYKI